MKYKYLTVADNIFSFAINRLQQLYLPCGL